MTFTYAFFIPAGVYDAPQSHLTDAHLHVASGTLRLGYGTSFDLAETTRHPAGSFLLVPAGAIHFDGADESGGQLLLGEVTVRKDQAHRVRVWVAVIVGPVLERQTELLGDPPRGDVVLEQVRHDRQLRTDGDSRLHPGA